jgi:hypothetical protein
MAPVYQNLGFSSKMTRVEEAKTRNLLIPQQKSIEKRRSALSYLQLNGERRAWTKLEHSLGCSGSTDRVSLVQIINYYQGVVLNRY